jgi:hypothetical protein
MKEHEEYGGISFGNESVVFVSLIHRQQSVKKKRVEADLNFHKGKRKSRFKKFEKEKRNGVFDVIIPKCKMSIYHYCL